MFTQYIILRKSWVLLFASLLGVTNLLIMLERRT